MKNIRVEPIKIVFFLITLFFILNPKIIHKLK